MALNNQPTNPNKVIFNVYNFTCGELHVNNLIQDDWYTLWCQWVDYIFAM